MFTLVTPHNAPRGFAESVGQAIGLCVIDKIHGLIEADWARIPIGPDNDLDYRIAVALKFIVELETKGNPVADNRHKAEVSAHLRATDRAFGSTEKVAAAPSLYW